MNNPQARSDLIYKTVSHHVRPVVGWIRLDHAIHNNRPLNLDTDQRITGAVSAILHATAAPGHLAPPIRELLAATITRSLEDDDNQQTHNRERTTATIREIARLISDALPYAPHQDVLPEQPLPRRRS